MFDDNNSVTSLDDTWSLVARTTNGFEKALERKKTHTPKALFADIVGPHTKSTFMRSDHIHHIYFHYDHMIVRFNVLTTVLCAVILLLRCGVIQLGLIQNEIMRQSI